MARGSGLNFVGLLVSQSATFVISLPRYTPQVGEESPERLTPADRQRVIETLRGLRERFPKLQMPAPLLDAYLEPPASPERCIFSRTTACVSADL